MKIRKTREDESLIVEVDTNKGVIHLISQYPDTPLNVKGCIYRKGEIIEVLLDWGFPLDYVTHLIMRVCLREQIEIPFLEPEQELFHQLTYTYRRPPQLFQPPLHYVTIQLKSVFSQETRRRGEQVASFFIQFLRNFTSAMAALLLHIGTH